MKNVRYKSIKLNT